MFIKPSKTDGLKKHLFFDAKMFGLPKSGCKVIHTPKAFLQQKN